MRINYFYFKNIQINASYFTNIQTNTFQKYTYKLNYLVIKNKSVINSQDPTGMNAMILQGRSFFILKSTGAPPL